MRAILIDPFEIAVRSIVLPHASHQPECLRAIYAALSHETVKVDTIDGVRLGKTGTDYLLVDGNGLVRDEKPQRWFMLWGWHGETLAGKGIIVGVTRNGSECSTMLDLIEVEWRTRFFKSWGLYLAPTAEPWRRPQ
jgi:hypothetical protein